MVFACLMLSVFATIDAYEQTASAVLFYMVSKRASKNNEEEEDDKEIEIGYNMIHILASIWSIYLSI